MKTKNATLLFILSFFISASHLSYSMDDAPANNSMTSMINNNMMRTRGWMNNFYKTYQEFGIIATLSSSFNMYNFKRITGLDENKLTSYNPSQLDVATNRVEKMIEYKGISDKLVRFLNTIEEARFTQEIGETNPENLPYNEEEAAQYMEEELQKQRNLKKQR